MKMLNPKLEILNSKQTQMTKIPSSKEEQIMGKWSLTKDNRFHKDARFDY